MIKAIELLLADIKKNAISKEHRHSEINLDCPECRFRILEGYLEWYLDLLKDEPKCVNCGTTKKIKPYIIADDLENPRYYCSKCWKEFRFKIANILFRNKNKLN